MSNTKLNTSSPPKPIANVEARLEKKINERNSIKKLLFLIKERLQNSKMKVVSSRRVSRADGGG